jgi:hypothetical protein
MRTRNITIVAPQTAGITAKLNTRKCDTAIVSADNLAGAETVTISQLVNGTAKAVLDAAGDAVVLTATLASVALEGGPMYSLVKSSTAGSCGLFAVLRKD